MKTTILTVVALAMSLVLAGCGGGSTPIPPGGADLRPPMVVSGSRPPTLDSKATHLVFVVTEDLAHNAGGLDPLTANLNVIGLNRALALGQWMASALLAPADVRGIHALRPTTHRQTADNLPDMVPLVTIEQFAMRCAFSQTHPERGTFVANSFPINVSDPSVSAGNEGIDFADADGSNVALAQRIIGQGQDGCHVMAMPFGTLQALLTDLKAINGYGYDVPATFTGPAVVYVLSVTTSSATLTALDSGVVGTGIYPTESLPVTSVAESSCKEQAPFEIDTARWPGSVPAGINTNATVHFIRHAEAHPVGFFDNGNQVAAGDVRALLLPIFLPGRIQEPDFVYAVDPEQPIHGGIETGTSRDHYSYVRPSLTVAPYAIANGLPIHLADTFSWGDSRAAAAFFFRGGRFSGKTLLVGWEHGRIRSIARSLLAAYSIETELPPWPASDYDSIWTFRLDGRGNLTLSNDSCEGIDTNALPEVLPTF